MSTDALTTVLILVWHGTSGNDNKGDRHTALLFLKDNDNAGVMVHAVNDGSGFEVQTNWRYDPLNSTTLAGSVQVAAIPKHIDVLAAIVQQVPVVNDGMWNCQNWIGDALQRLVGYGLITAKLRDDRVNEMIDILLQSADDQPY